jgi:hypothetical protein
VVVLLGLTGVLTANGGAVFNEGGADVDFRVESDTLTHALFVDGATGNSRVLGRRYCKSVVGRILLGLQVGVKASLATDASIFSSLTTELIGITSGGGYSDINLLMVQVLHSRSGLLVMAVSRILHSPCRKCRCYCGYIRTYENKLIRQCGYWN